MSEIIHNYQRQVIFTGREHSITPNDQLTFTIAPSGDNSYFNLYKSRLELKIKLTLDKAPGAATTVVYVPVKKNMSGIVNNTKATYTYWEEGELKTLTMSSDNENVGQVKSILNAIRTPRKQHYVDEGLKELSYIYNDDSDDETAIPAERPYGNRLFFDCLKFTFAANATTAYCNITIPFCDIFEGLSSEKFINLTQLDAEVYFQDYTNYFKFDGGNIILRPGATYVENKTLKLSSVVIDSAYIWLHNYVTADQSFFDPADTIIPKTQIQTKTFKLQAGASYIDNNVIVNFPIKFMYMFFTSGDSDFSKLLDVKFKKLVLSIAGTQKRFIDVDNTNTKEGTDHSLWEFTDYLTNSNDTDYETLLTYRTWTKQFRIIGQPLSEYFPMKASNQLLFEFSFESVIPAGGAQMHMVFIRDE